MNYAEELIKEVEKEAKEEKWEAEDFMNYFYPNNTPEKSRANSFNSSGDEVSGFFGITSFSPEISFKFNYLKDKPKPLEDLGIEVYNGSQ